MRQPPDTPARAALHSARRLWHAHTRLATGALLFALALALRLYRLGAQSLWLDEGGTWAEVTGKGWGALLADLISPNAAYPLYHLLLKAWVGLAGDSEWALRFPSALAGAAAVVAVYLAAHELSASRRPEPAAAPLAGLLCATAPFALWQAQDAKVYSLLLLCAALLLWALLRALQRGTPGDWLALLLVALVSIFVHRLALLAIIAALLAVGLAWPFRRAGVPAGGRWLLLLGALLGAVAAIAGIVRAVGIESRGGSGHVPAGPLTGLWLTLAHFALDRGNIGGWLGLPLLVWALPALALTLWGLALLARDAWRGRPAALAIVCMFAAPLLLFAAGLAFARLFESRYATVAFPAWLLVVLYPLIAPARQGFAPQAGAPRWLALRAWLPGCCYTALLLVHAAVLLQPQHGLFSGAPVKEDWRSAIMALARRAHPDDLLILHPYYVEPMWRYYAPRVTPDPLPQPVRFDLLGQGYCRDIAQADALALVECYRRSYEEAFNRAAQGRKRMLMLIAPEHARTIDPPKTLDELRAAWEAAPPKTRGDPPAQADTYGMLGLRFQYAKNQRTWPCGGDTFVGVELMCASFPSFYMQKGAAAIPQPAVPLDATFGGELRLRGYSLSLLGGQARPGGALPITLYWAAVAHPSRSYTMFLHLCRDCSAPPLANDDAPPLQGYPPAGDTTTWQLGDPVHDERSLALPAGLAPGRYTLLLGVYPAGQPDEAARLPVQSHAPVLGGTRLLIGQVTIGPN